MSRINTINAEASTLGVEVSVSPDGIGYDLYEADTGVWLQTTDDLDEAEYEIENIKQELRKYCG
tara:strand:- start:3561 stop:3752 length:192 start_codon:yes stop_codon:yes gene_type:complete